ncbi:MAG: hypothetical protein ISS52_06760 [Dehalococcoidia bacterium]|nr:hypothetical protein [Dehalococcoidia bacterium]
MEAEVKDGCPEAAGLSLHELDDHLLELRDGDYVVARFSATGANAAEITKAANNYLGKKRDENESRSQTPRVR